MPTLHVDRCIRRCYRLSTTCKRDNLFVCGSYLTSAAVCATNPFVVGFWGTGQRVCWLSTSLQTHQLLSGSEWECPRASGASCSFFFFLSTHLSTTRRKYLRTWLESSRFTSRFSTHRPLSRIEYRCQRKRRLAGIILTLNNKQQCTYESSFFLLFLLYCKMCRTIHSTERNLLFKVIQFSLNLSNPIQNKEQNGRVQLVICIKRWKWK